MSTWLFLALGLVDQPLRGQLPRKQYVSVPAIIVILMMTVMVTSSGYE